MKTNLIKQKKSQGLDFLRTKTGLTNEVKLKRDLLCELSKSKLVLNPTTAMVETDPQPGSYRHWLQYWEAPFDLLPSCGYRISGQRVKAGLGKLDQRIELGGIIGQGLNRKYNRQLMNHYKKLKETSSRKESRRQGKDY